MNIIKAFSSGKRVKRKNQNFFMSSENFVTLNTDSILSDDWEVEPKKIEITVEQLKKAFYGSYCLSRTKNARFDTMKKLLGFE